MNPPLIRALLSCNARRAKVKFWAAYRSFRLGSPLRCASGRFAELSASSWNDLEAPRAPFKAKHAIRHASYYIGCRSTEAEPHSARYPFPLEPRLCFAARLLAKLRLRQLYALLAGERVLVIHKSCKLLPAEMCWLFLRKRKLSTRLRSSYV